MKIFSIVLKVVVALAAIAGAVYVALTYGEKIVAWVKEKLPCCGCTCECDCDCDCECDEECECDGECKCRCCDDDVAVEIVEEAGEAVADEADFEG